MKIVYIAHPIGGDVKKNLEKIAMIGRHINLNEPGVIPFAPYYMDCYSLIDDEPNERARGIQNSIHFVNPHFIDEIRLYGDKISAGMGVEIETARQKRIRIIPMTEGTKRDYRKMLGLDD